MTEYSSLLQNDHPPEEKVVSCLLYCKSYQLTGRIMDQSIHSSSYKEPQHPSADFRFQECSAVGQVSFEGCDISLQAKVVSTSKPQNGDRPSKGL